MTAFSAAMNAIFADANMAADALWLDQGLPEAVPCRVIRRAPDDVTDFGGARIWSETTTFDIRCAEIPNILPGDEIRIGEDRFKVQGKPVRDRDRLIWTVDTVPA